MSTPDNFITEEQFRRICGEVAQASYLAGYTCAINGAEILIRAALDEEAAEATVLLLRETQLAFLDKVEPPLT